MAKQGLVNARRKEKKRYTTKGTAFRTLGELISYKAASWKFHRRLIARKQHDPKTNQIDLRLIQTNIIKGATVLSSISLAVFLNSARQIPRTG